MEGISYVSFLQTAWKEPSLKVMYVIYVSLNVFNENIVNVYLFTNFTKIDLTHKTCYYSICSYSYKNKLNCKLLVKGITVQGIA